VLSADQWPAFGWFWAALLASTALGGWWSRAGHRRGGAGLGRWVLPPMTVLVGATAGARILAAPYSHWGAARLAPAAGLLRGYPLYTAADSGPVLNTIYTPLSALAYLPAAALGRPSSAVLAGASLSLAYALLPVAVLARVSRPKGVDGPGRSGFGEVGALAVLGFATLVLSSPPLAVLARIHADVPAVGLGALACVVLHAARGRSAASAGVVVGSALLAVLAAAAKQTLAPVAVVVPVWVGLRWGLGAGVRSALAVLACAGGVAAAAGAAFGFGPMAFNVLEVPGRHPWLYADRPTFLAFAALLGELAADALPVLGPLALARAWWPAARRGTDSGGLAAREPWALFAAAALALAPTALLGRIKVGGNLNNFAPVVYFGAMALAALVLGRAAGGRGGRLRRGSLAAAVAVSLVSPLGLGGGLVREWSGVRSLADNPQDAGYRYARQHPGEAYFPWNPLSTLLAEGRLTDFEYGLFDRDLAGRPLPAEEFRKDLPAGLRLVAFPPDRQSEWVLRLLPEFSRRCEVPELPGWVCYERR